MEFISRRIGLVLLLALLVGCGVAGCGESRDATSIHHPILNGTPVGAVNFGGAVRLEILGTKLQLIGFESGSLVEEDFVLSACHAFPPQQRRQLRRRYSIPVDTEPVSFVSSEIRWIVPHPTCTFHEVSEENRPPVTLQGLDVAVSLLEDGLPTQPGLLPRVFSDDGVTDADLIQAGYGLFEENTTDTSKAGEQRIFVTEASQEFPALSLQGLVPTRGVDGRQVGESLILEKGTDAETGADIRTLNGDSGGPTISTDDFDVTVGVLEGGRRFGGKEVGGFTTLLRPEIVQWVSLLNVSRQVPLEFDFNGAGRPDQVIFAFDGAQETILVEPGEGELIEPDQPSKLRRLHFRDRPAGLPPVQFVAAGSEFNVLEIDRGVGFFNEGRSSPKPQADVVGLIGDRAVVVFDVFEDPDIRELGTTSYDEVLVTEINNDPFDDLEAERADEGKDFFFGTGSKTVAGPFDSKTPNTCRSGNPRMQNACGSKSFPGDCWCNEGCGENCCEDIEEVCPALVGEEENPIIRILKDLVGAVPLDVFDVETTQPTVVLSGPNGSSVGTVIAPGWVLTAAGRLQDLQAGDITARQVGGAEIPLLAILKDPDSELALVRMGAGSPINVPSEQPTALYSGTEAEVALEPTLSLFGMAPGEDATRAAQFPAFALSSGEGLGFCAAEVPGLLDEAVEVLPGSPLVSRDGFVAGVTAQSETLEIPRRTEEGQEVIRELTLHDQISLTEANTRPGDMRPSARHWLQQTLRRARLRDVDANGFQDLWGTRSSAAGLELVAFPMEETAGAQSTSMAGPQMDRSGQWRLVGRANLGGAQGVIWREVDTGEVEIWKMSGPLTMEERFSFFVSPEWEIGALGDVDGDEVTDVIWSSESLGLNFFWLLHRLDQFETVSEIEENPGALVRYGLWFNGMLGTNLNRQFELAGSDHFVAAPSGVFEDNGAEQATVDLLWRERDGETVIIWEMTRFFRSCADISDPLRLSNCASEDDSLLTYELSRNMLGMPAQDAFWEVAGTGDYNLDGRADIVWHARGAEAPEEQVGRVMLWLTRADATFEPILVTDASGAPLVIDPGQIVLNGR